MAKKLSKGDPRGPPALNATEEARYIQVLVAFLEFGKAEKLTALDALHQMLSRRSNRSDALRHMVVDAGAVEPLCNVLRDSRPERSDTRGFGPATYWEGTPERTVRGKAGGCLYSIAVEAEHAGEHPLRDYMVELFAVTKEGVDEAYGQVVSALWHRILEAAGFQEGERTVVPDLLYVSDALRLPGTEPKHIWLAEPKYRAGRRERFERDKAEQASMLRDLTR